MTPDTPHLLLLYHPGCRNSVDQPRGLIALLA
jgi:hypothetical protein